MTNEYYDLNGRLIEVGDIIIIPRHSYLRKCIVLGFTNSGSLKLSVFKIYQPLTNQSGYSWMTNENNVELHNSMFYLKQFAPGTYICEKHAIIPEELRKFIK